MSCSTILFNIIIHAYQLELNWIENRKVKFERFIMLISDDILELDNIIRVF